MNGQIDSIKATNGKACIITKEGKIVLEPKVDIDVLYHLSYGLCQVEKGGKCGYINKFGELVIPFKYEKASPFSENGLAFVVSENGLGGYIDKNDTFVIAPIYETGSQFKFGFAAVSRKGKYKYIYANGHQAIGSTFHYASGFSDTGLAKVIELDGRHSLMDTTSQVVLNLKAGNELAELVDGSRVTKFMAPDGREALINAAGDIVTGFYDQIIISSYSRMNPFCRDGLWGYLDDRGNEVIANIYTEVSEFTDRKTALVKAYHPLAENNVWELYINERDEIIDHEVIESSTRHLHDRFSKINRPKKALALAVKKIGSKD